MSPSAEEIRKQLVVLQQQLIEQEAKEKEEAENPLIISIDSFNRTRKVLALKTNKYRDDYVELMRSIPSRRWFEMQKLNEIALSDYPTFRERLQKLAPPIFWQNTKAEDQLNEYVNQPDVRVDFVSSKFLIYLKDLETYRWDIFGGSLNPIVKYHTVEQYFSLPYNEGSKLLERLNYLQEYSDYRIYWEDLALTSAEQELTDRNKINDLAALEYNPDYDFDLNGNKLFKFQTVGVGFADHSLFNIGNEGVLIGDEMGLGKSPQSIAVAHKRNLRVLILTPAAGRDNWHDYVRKFTGQFAKMFSKTEPDKFDFEDMLINKVQWNIMAYDTIARGKETGEKLSNGEPEIRYLWADLINLSKFDIIFLDECHKLKNEEAGRTKAFLLLKPKKFIAISGTPILNRPAEFAPILSKLDPKNFGDTKQFIWRYSDGKNGAKNTQELRELLKPIMIRRTKSKVLPDLPPVIPMVEKYIMNEREKQIYDSVLNQVLDEIPDLLPDGDDNFNFFASNILVKIMRLKQVCALMVAESVAEFAFEAYHNSESDHKKVIIFSQFIPIVDKIKNLLGSEALYITGEDHSPSERLRIVKEFNASTFYKYLVASTKAASEQLNITSAGTVIFNDLMWTPADHVQAIGRAYGRLNDCHGVDAHYFVVKDTIMEWLQKILGEKEAVFNEVVEGVEADRSNNNSVIKDLIIMLRGMKRK